MGLEDILGRRIWVLIDKLKEDPDEITAAKLQELLDLQHEIYN